MKRFSTPLNHPNVQRVRSVREKSRRGAMLFLIAILLFGFMIAAAFSIDIAQMHLARTELRSATDAAAKAAATTLADTLDRGRAINTGQTIAAANLVNGQPMRVAAGDFQFGSSQRRSNGKFVFRTGSGNINSVRVDGRRTVGSAAGAVPLLFGNVTGVQIFEPRLSATATYIERDVTLVVDRSGSMSGQKINDLRSALVTFVNVLNSTPVQERVGLASYSDFATENVQLTTDYTQINNAMAAMIASGFTSISRGMEAGGQVAARGRPIEFVERTMIVMTDGRHNRGIEPRNVAITLASQGVTIHTITFGGDADRTRMREIAAIGGGRAFHADTGLQLENVYRQIALTLGTVITE